MLVPCLTRLPLPPMSPPKLLLPPTPVLRVKVARPTVPLPLKEPMVWSPSRASVAPDATLAADGPISRLALARVSVPVFTVTVSAAAVPVRLLAKVDVRAPAPRLALTVPPFTA